jgi:DNA-binding beta-propeller fold protein YncE
MKRRAALLFCLAGLAVLARAESGATLTLVKTIALPSVAGRFDHFAFDPADGRLFVAATGNHSVEVVSVKTGKRIETIAGLGKPHGLAWVADQGKLFVADGSLAALKVYTGSPLKEVATLALSDDADDMVYDAQTGLLYVGHGGSSAAVPGRIAVVNTRDNSLVQNLPVSAHPEALEIDPDGKRVFANIADSSEIVVIDAASHSIKATWKLSRASDNVPVAFDAEDHALLVGCRKPARSVSVDAGTGAEVSDLPSATGADDLFYEAQRHRAYLISGSGAVDIYQVAPDKSLKALDTIKTGPGAKTGLLVPSLKALFVAVPATSAEPAEIRMYATGL